MAAMTEHEADIFFGAIAAALGISEVQHAAIVLRAAGYVMIDDDDADELDEWRTTIH
jgi:hypothetical protein